MKLNSKAPILNNEIKKKYLKVKLVILVNKAINFLEFNNMFFFKTIFLTI
jgi:hypothetical protein